MIAAKNDKFVYFIMICLSHQNVIFMKAGIFFLLLCYILESITLLDK